MAVDGAHRQALGFGPRPTQTVYEYAAALGELVPVAQRDIETVADAKVETAYAGAKLAARGSTRSVRAARRLRISLLRLVFRRPKRRRRVLSRLAVALERARAGPPLRLPRGAASSRSGARCSVRFAARRTGRPPRSSTTVIPVSAIVNIQKWVSGSPNSVSSVTLNTPSWPTSTDHGWSAPRADARVPADLRAGPASRADSRARGARGRRRAHGGRGPGPARATRRRAPTPPTAGAASPTSTSG